MAPSDSGARASRAAAVYGLAYANGMRSREASLANLDRLPAKPRDSEKSISRTARRAAGGLRAGRNALYRAGIQGYHDARAAYACRRYSQRTGRAAPIVAGHRIAPRVLDQAARRRIAYELGHGRVQIVASYVGSVA